MNKAEMIDQISESVGLSKTDAKKALDAMLCCIKDCLADGGSVSFTGFGTFSVSQREARTGINPITKKPMKIAAKKVVKFKAGKDLKDCVN